VAEIVTLTMDTTREAARAVYLHEMSWYDALIWASARAAGCSTLYTEDFQDGRDVEGVTYRNPFIRD
jgi:predicted nucleic acid-binding protein